MIISFPDVKIAKNIPEINFFFFFDDFYSITTDLRTPFWLILILSINMRREVKINFLTQNNYVSTNSESHQLNLNKTNYLPQNFVFFNTYLWPNVWNNWNSSSKYVIFGLKITILYFFIVYLPPRHQNGQNHSRNQLFLFLWWFVEYHHTLTTLLLTFF